MTITSRARVLVSVCALAALFAAPCRAQDLEPRAYAPSPKDANFLLVNYSYQSGDVLFDPSLPFSDVRAFINGVVGGYGHTFSLFGRISSVAVVVPYVWASVDGNVGETYQSITRSGLADMRLRFVVNLIGGPALTAKESRTASPLRHSASASSPSSPASTATRSHQHRDEPLGVPAGVRPVVPDGTLDARGGGWSLAFPRQRPHLPRPERPLAGPALQLPGARRLHGPARPLGRRGRDVLCGRQDVHQRRPRRHAAGEQPGRPDRLGPRREGPLDQGVRLQGRGRQDRVPLRLLRNRVPVPLAQQVTRADRPAAS